MKKIIIFLLILTVIINQSIVLAQTTTSQVSLKDYIIPQCGTGSYIENQVGQPVDDEAIKECATNFSLNFNTLKTCVRSSGVNTSCILTNFPTIANKLNDVVDCLENAIPDYGYLPLPIPGVGKGGFNFKTLIEMIKNQLGMEALGRLASLVSGFLDKLFGGGLLGGGKVPTDDKGAQGLVGKSIEETAKNFNVQLQTGIKLGLSDAQEYLKFKLKSTLESLVYNKIVRNFIPDIQQYRYLRMTQAYTRAIDKLLKPFTQNPDIQCLPFEVKACAYKLLKEADSKAAVFINRAKNPKAAKRIFKSIIKTQRFSILNKPNCDPNDPNTFHIYTALGLNPSVIAQKSSATSTAYIKPTTQILAKAEDNDRNLAFQLTSFFANPFKIINLRNLLGQAGGTSSQNNLIDQDTIINQAIEITNCNLIFSTSTAKIFQELDEELSTFNAYTNEPGGTTFMPKTSCLKTDAEAKLETLQAQLEEEKKKSNPDNNKITSLQNTIEEYKKIAEQQRKSGITGESSFCVKKDEVKNPIATYEDLREKISKNDFDFLNQLSSGNVFVTFIRGWINSHLFKLIDKGFSDFNKGENQELFMQNNLEAIYSKQQKDCERLNNSGVAGLKESCKSIVMDNREISIGMTKFNTQNKLIEIKEILQLIPELRDRNLAYSSTITEAIATITTNYITYINPGLLGEFQNYTNNLGNILSTLDNLSSTTQEKLGLASTTLNQLNDALNNLKNSTTAQEINRLTQQIQQLLSQIENIKNSILQKLNNIQRESNNPKINTLFSAAGYNVDNIFPNGVRLYEYDLPHFDIDENASSDKRFMLGKNEPLSFYKYFYPKLVNKIAQENLQNLYNTDILDILNALKGSSGSSGRKQDPPLVIADMSAKIFSILYNIPSKAVEEKNQKNLLTAIGEQINNFFNTSENSTLTPEDISKLKIFFTNLESIATRTLIFINRRGDIFPDNHSFTLSIDGGPSFDFDTRETFTTLFNISSNFKALFDEIESNNIINQQNQIINLNKELSRLNQQYENEMNDILNKLGIDTSKIDELYKEIQQIREELNNVDTELSSLCSDYNNSIIELEASINAQIRNQSSGSSGPPSEEEGGSGGGSATNFGKFLALIVKNLTGNIFEIINIKPKRVEIK